MFFSIACITNYAAVLFAVTSFAVIGNDLICLDEGFLKSFWGFFIYSEIYLCDLSFSICKILLDFYK